MNIKIKLVIESAEGALQAEQDIAQLHRGDLSAATLGLTLAESKEILQVIQQEMVNTQVESYIEQQTPCPDCGQARKHKGRHQMVYRSVFGKLQLDSPRFFHCGCQNHSTKSFSPLALLLSERTSPEYLYLQTKFAALMSYGLSIDLLTEVLPLEGQINISSVRNHVHELGERLDGQLGEEQVMFADGCPRDWEQLPRPDLPLVVGIDGGYLKRYPDKEDESSKSFEVIVGKSIPDSGASKCLGFVQTYDLKPKRRLFEMLQSQGMQLNYSVLKVQRLDRD